MITRHQTQYLAWQLASANVDARIDLNPHQADAALFNLQNSGIGHINGLSRVDIASSSLLSYSSAPHQDLRC
jgi:hypothetical protein